MATYTTLRNGSSGSDVKKLQQALVDAGYSVGSAGVDGIYGSATASAVKAYQKANGLSVDGIAGNQTLGSLYGGSTATTTTTAPTTTTTPASTAKSYLDNESVTSTKSKYDELLNQKPVDNTAEISEATKQAMEKIMNREKFSYDLNGDALYQQYKDQYINQGKLAMQDTIGQAAALTGGYGNSYAQSVGQQTFQGYLQQLNDRVPELYQLALDQYNQEGDNLYKQYSMLSDREQTEYGYQRDKVADWESELNRAYSEHRDAISDSQWEASYDEQVRQFEQEYNLKVQELEEAKRHNLITEDQAQQEIDLAKRELEQKIASAKVTAQKEAASKVGSNLGEKIGSALNGLSNDGGVANPDYSKWKAGDWEEYFAQIRQSEGQSAAEKELEYFTSKGLIPKNMVTYGAIGARGSSKGH